MKKSLMLLVGTGLLVSSLTACSNKPVLKVYNWGEYIDLSLLSEFQSKYDCKVSYQNFSSNELAITTMQKSTFDIIVPSDYAIEQLVAEDMVQELDWTKILTYYNDEVLAEDYAYDATKNAESREAARDIYADGLLNIIDLLKNDTENSFDFLKYAAPYFWGNVGIVYNKTVENLESAVQEKGWDVVRDGRFKIAYYDSSRDGFMPALKQLGYSMNTTNMDEINAAKNWLIEQKTLVGANNLKYYTDEVLDKVADGSSDLGLVYSGDAAYIMDSSDYEMGFFVPETGTNVWADGMVIQKGAKNVDLAHKFIAFMTTQDSSFRNADETFYNASNKLAFAQQLGEYLDYADLFNYQVRAKDEIYRYLGSDMKRVYDDAWLNDIKS